MSFFRILKHIQETKNYPLSQPEEFWQVISAFGVSEIGSGQYLASQASIGHVRSVFGKSGQYLACQVSN